MCPTLFMTPWTVGSQGPLSMGFSRKEYWSWLPFPPPGDFLIQGSNPGLLRCRQILYQLSYQDVAVTFGYGHSSQSPDYPVIPSSFQEPAFTWYLTYNKLFIGDSLFYFHESPTTFISFFPFWNWGNWGSERLPFIRSLGWEHGSHGRVKTGLWRNPFFLLCSSQVYRGKFINGLLHMKIP